VEEETAALEEAKTNVISMGIVQHTLSVEKISDLEHKTMALLNAVRSNIQNKRLDFKHRRMMLVPIWIFVIVMGAALWAKYKELKRKKKKNGKDKHE
jgi:hypothetical protein